MLSFRHTKQTSKNVADTTFKQHNIFKNAFSQSKMTQIIANELFTVFTSFLIFLLISSSWFFYKFASNQSQIYQFISPQDFLYCILVAFIHHVWLYLIIFNRSGDIEKNPGTKLNSYQSFSICQ